MHKLNFSETTITPGEWYEFVKECDNVELDSRVLVVAADSPLEFLAGPLNSLERIVVTSSDFNDGRFFSIGRQIRLLGYRGRLTLVGNVLPDQYTALRACGFDDALNLQNFAINRVVALDEALALPRVEDSVIRNPVHSINAGISQ